MISVSDKQFRILMCLIGAQSAVMAAAKDYQKSEYYWRGITDLLSQHIFSDSHQCCPFGLLSTSPSLTGSLLSGSRSSGSVDMSAIVSKGEALMLFGKALAMFRDGTTTVAV